MLFPSKRWMMSGSPGVLWPLAIVEGKAVKDNTE